MFGPLWAKGIADLNLYEKLFLFLKQTKSFFYLLQAKQFQISQFFSYNICIFVILFSASVPVSPHSSKGLMTRTRHIDLIMSEQYEVWRKHKSPYITHKLLYILVSFFSILTHTYAHKHTHHMVDDGVKFLLYYTSIWMRLPDPQHCILDPYQGSQHTTETSSPLTSIHLYMSIWSVVTKLWAVAVV